MANSKGTLQVARSEISSACLMTGPDLEEFSWEEKLRWRSRDYRGRQIGEKPSRNWEGNLNYADSGNFISSAAF